MISQRIRRVAVLTALVGAVAAALSCSTIVQRQKVEFRPAFDADTSILLPPELPRGSENQRIAILPFRDGRKGPVLAGEVSRELARILERERLFARVDLLRFTPSPGDYQLVVQPYAIVNTHYILHGLISPRTENHFQMGADIFDGVNLHAEPTSFEGTLQNIPGRRDLRNRVAAGDVTHAMALVVEAALAEFAVALVRKSVSPSAYSKVADVTMGPTEGSLSPTGQTHEFGRYLALVIGNDRYTTLPQLRTAANDARAIAKVLRDEYGFEVTTLTDATRAEVMSALAGIDANEHDTDNLLIFYAGHGYFDDRARRGYWLPVDATPYDKSNWISNADITDALRAMDTRHVIVVADSCYSGSLNRALEVRPTVTAGMIQRFLLLRSRVVLTSGGLEPVPDDSGDGHSVFANQLMRALRTNQGIMEGAALFVKIRRAVMLNANQTPEFGDIRLTNHEGGDFLFVRRSD